MNRIKILDSLRGFAAVIVVFHHFFTRMNNLFSSLPIFLYKFLHFISELNLIAVLFFFILSGYSIRLSIKNENILDKNVLREYFNRRFNRVVPLYILAIMFTILIGYIISPSLIFSREFSFKNLLGNLFFLQSSDSYKGNWFSPYGNNGPLWSISFEVFFYFFIPIFLSLNATLSNKVKLFREKQDELKLIFALILSLICIVINKKIFFPYIAFCTLFFNWYNGFYLGELFIKEESVNYFKSLLKYIFVIFFINIMKFKYPSSNLDKIIIGSWLSIIFILGSLISKIREFKLIEYIISAFNYLFYKIGRGSYAIYLFHFPLILVLRHNNTSFFISIITISILFISSFYFEKLLIRLFFRIRLF
jgi:peptidoglycan/LPS O-acetylase OafA/YrhL